MRVKKFTVLTSALILLCTTVIPAAQERGIKVKVDRLALVIGNGAYQTAPLKNPINDAEDMAASLKKLGFKVILKKNADQRTMEDIIRYFGRQLRGGDVGLFYFAGHGVQVESRNYLMPVDAKIESESDVKYEAVDAGRVLGKMEDAENQLNIVILDACRNNPYSRAFRSDQSGLARMDAPTGSLVAYSTAPGEVAADGPDRNGIFTKHLIKHMMTPNLSIEHVLKRVRIDVAKQTNGRQIPWESSSLMGDFYFNTSKTAEAVKAFESNAATPNQKTNVAALPKTSVKPERKDSQFKIAVFPIYIKQSPFNARNIAVKNAALDSLRKVFSTNQMWDLKYSYYDLGKNNDTTMIDKSIIANRVESDLWIKGDTWSKKKLNVDLIYNLCTELEVDFAVTYGIYYNDLVWDSNIYIIDVLNKEEYSKNKSFDVISFHQHFISFARETFLAYRTEIQSKSAFGIQTATITNDSKRNVEPWTGIWELKYHLGGGHKFVLKQNGKTVKSADDSCCKFSGTIEGNTLKGWIQLYHGSRKICSLKISSDNKSFNGSFSAPDWTPRESYLYGRRRQ